MEYIVSTLPISVSCQYNNNCCYSHCFCYCLSVNVLIVVQIVVKVISFIVVVVDVVNLPVLLVVDDSELFLQHHY